MELENNGPIKLSFSYEAVSVVGTLSRQDDPVVCQGLDGLAAEMGLGTRVDTTLSRSKARLQSN